MNKLLVAILAICLVSVHAFVKRDAPEDPKNTNMDTIKNQIEELTNSVNKHISDTFNPEVIKKGLAEFVNFINNATGIKQPASDTPK